MDEEAAEELAGLQSHRLVGVAGSRVPVTEGDTLPVEGEDARVADGDSVGVVGQIRQNLRGTAEGGLAVDDPVLARGAGEEKIERKTASVRTRPGMVNRPADHASRIEQQSRGCGTAAREL